MSQSSASVPPTTPRQFRQRIRLGEWTGPTAGLAPGHAQAGIPVRHIELGRNVPMYITNRQCMPAGAFKGPLVVSMRPIPSHLVAKAVLITSRYPSVHGAPVAIGNPESLGIRDIERPDFGDPVPIHENEVPVFWACGVTPQAAAMTTHPEIMITHAPGGATVAFTGANPVQVIVFAQAINGVLLPISTIYLIIVMNQSRIMGKFTNNPTQNILGWAVTLVTILLGLRLVLRSFGIIK